MKVSVIVPVYNALPYLEECIASLTSQTLRDIEIICVDDGSTDDSWQTLQSLTKKDSRIKPIQQANAGVGAARNKGISAAQGEFLSFVDSDDLVLPDFLQSLVERAESCNADLVIGGIEEFFTGTDNVMPFPLCTDSKLAGGAFTLEDMDIFTTQLTTPSSCRCLYKRSFLESKGILFPEHLKAAEDLAFVYKCLFNGPTMALCNKILYRYRRDVNNSLTHSYRGATTLVSLGYVKGYVLENNLDTPTVMKHLNNLVVSSTHYALNSSYDLREFSENLQMFFQDWRPVIKGHAHEVEASLQDAAEALTTLSMEEVLFWSFSVMRGGVDTLMAETARLNREIDANRQLVAALRTENDMLRAEADVLRGEIDNVRGSNSYKIGNALMSPLSKIKRR